MKITLGISDFINTGKILTRWTCWSLVPKRGSSFFSSEKFVLACKTAKCHDH